MVFICFLMPKMTRCHLETHQGLTQGFLSNLSRALRAKPATAPFFSIRIELPIGWPFELPIALRIALPIGLAPQLLIELRFKVGIELLQWEALTISVPKLWVFCMPFGCLFESSRRMVWRPISFPCLPIRVLILAWLCGSLRSALCFSRVWQVSFEPHRVKSSDAHGRA